MERIELSAFRNRLLVDIDEPKAQYENLDKELFEDFGLTMNSKGSSQFEAIVKSCDHFKKILNDKVQFILI